MATIPTCRRALGKAWPVLLSLLLVAALFVAERRLDFVIAEEGFLWCGAVAAAHGGVPLRDFYSYDPGRYYWAAAWELLFGDGILTLRLAVAAFQVLGLSCGLLAARRAVARPWLLALAGAALLLWMVPRNKSFEPCLAMAAVYFGVLLIERPTPRRHFAAGCLAGIAAVFGKNLGLYIAAAYLPLVLLLWLRAERGKAEAMEDGRGSPPQAPTRRLSLRLLAVLAGMVTGFSPVLVLCLAVPGFFRSFVDSILFFIEQGRTNFPLPIPWPWRQELAGTDLYLANYRLAFSLSYLLLPAVYAAAAWLGARAQGEELRRRALSLAAALVGACYLHHAFSRADLHHLAQSIHPCLLGLIALPALAKGRPARLAAGLAAGALILWLTAMLTPREHPLVRMLTAVRPVDRFVAYDMRGETLWIRAQKVRALRALGETLAENVPASEPVLIAPHLAGMYPALGRTSPVWDIYPIWPAVGRLDERMVRELKTREVKWALVQRDFGLDGRADLRFEATHPLVWRYLMRDFDRVATPALSRESWLLRRKGG